MNKAQKTTTKAQTTGLQQVTDALAEVQADFITSYAAALDQELKEARAFMDAFDLKSAGTYGAEPYYKAQRKWWALTGKDFKRMALAAWVKRMDTLVKGIDRTGVQLDKLISIEAAPSAADFRLKLVDSDGHNCCARAVLVLPCQKRPHMRFICT